MMINLQNDGPGVVRAGRVSCLKLSLITYRIDHNQRIFQARNTTCKHTEEFMEINEKIPITSYMYKFGNSVGNRKSTVAHADLAHALETE